MLSIANEVAHALVSLYIYRHRQRSMQQREPEQSPSPTPLRLLALAGNTLTTSTTTSLTPHPTETEHMHASMPSSPHNHAAANLSSASSSTPSSKWGPYSSARDFDANIAMILIALVCATVLAFLLNAVVRLLLRRLRRASSAAAESQKQGREGGGPAEAPTTLVYSAGTELAGEGAECAICLAEFAEGERVAVLPACHHGFHARCAQAWLASRPSCPTCRATCRAPHQEP